MRDFKNMKRQRGRNRGGQSQGGGGKPQHNANRAWESNGPDGIKVRGHAQSVYEKYQQLARDAFSGGDRVLAENYLQHGEHYFRLMRTLQPNRPVADIVSRDVFATGGYDIDFEDESLDQAPPEAPVEGEGADAASDGTAGVEARDGRRDEFRRDREDGRRDRDDRPRDDGRQERGEFRRDREDRGEFRRDRDDRPRDRDDRGEPRRDRDRDFRREDRFRDDRPREDRVRDDRARDDRPREDRPREDGGQDRPREGRRDRFERDRERPRDRDFERGERRDRSDRERGDRERPDQRPDVAAEADTPAPAEVIQPVRAAAPQDADVAAPEESARLRSGDGDFSPAPAFLQGAVPAPSPAPEGEEVEERRPRTRRRRAPKSFEGAEGATAPEAAPASEDV